MIPKIFFQTSKAPLDPSISEMIHYYLTDDWVYKHYLDADILQFFEDYPDPEFPDMKAIFLKIRGGEHKADLFRYYHIYKIGGFFMDSDAMIYESIDRVLQDYSFVSVNCTMESMPNSIFQGVLGAEAKNPIIYEALKAFYNMDLEVLHSNYHHLCKELYVIYNSYEGDKTNYKLYLEVANGKEVIDQSTLLFRHFWDNKEAIPDTLAIHKENYIKKIKNLVYFCVFYNDKYFKLLELLLKTMQFFSKTDEFDLLIVTNKNFEPLVQGISRDLGIPLKIFCIDFTTIFQAACARLYIFNYKEIYNYKKILYLDTDIIIKKDLTNVFSIGLEGKLYGLQSGTIASPSFGNQFFDFSRIDPSTPGINSGTLLFKNCLAIKNLFSRIQEHVEDHVRKGLHIPYCMDQPFINYHAIKDSLYNNKYMNQHVSLFEDEDLVQNYETSSICHFSYPIGNFGHKYDRMKKFVNKILNEALQEQPKIHGIIGRSYDWESGYIKFNLDGLETKWGKGQYEILNENLRHIRVFWSGFYHILKMSDNLDSYICIRTWPDDFSLVKGNLIKSDGLLYIYGDSHAYLSFKNLKIPHMQLFQYAVTMHRVARDKQIVNFHRSHVGVDNIFCLVYGEVDVRCHIGKQILLGRNVIEICKNLVEEYFLTIKSHITLYKTIIIVAIPPPTDPLDHTHQGAHPDGPLPFIGTNEERLAYTSLMNGFLEEESKKAGYVYFNPFAFYTREDGCLKYELSDNCIHIGDNKHFLDEFLKKLKLGLN